MLPSKLECKSILYKIKFDYKLDCNFRQSYNAFDKCWLG